MALVLGIYEMTERNTPGVGPVLQRHGLTGIPEAHCYLRSRDMHIDVTKPTSHGKSEPILHFLHEEEIDPQQITVYKVSVHKTFLKTWVAENAGKAGLTLADVWKIREECIKRLSQ
jgi:hypothetical protein